MKQNKINKYKKRGPGENRKQVGENGIKILADHIFVGEGQLAAGWMVVVRLRVREHLVVFDDLELKKIVKIFSFLTYKFIFDFYFRLEKPDLCAPLARFFRARVAPQIHHRFVLAEGVSKIIREF